MKRTIEDLAALIHSTTGLDVCVLDSACRVMEEYSRLNTPDELFFSSGELERLWRLLGYGETFRCAHAVTKAGLAYSVARIRGCGHEDRLLCMGPFLELPVPERFEELAAGGSGRTAHERQAILSFLDALPRVDRGFASDIGRLVHALAQDGLQPMETIEAAAAGEGTEGMEDVPAKALRGARAEVVNRIGKGTAAAEQPVGPARNDTSPWDKNRIEDFFTWEKRLRIAVQTGNIRLYRQIAKGGDFFNYFRFKVTRDRLRAAKNLSLGYNAMLQLAALDGGADIFLVHALLWKYVRITESAHHVDELVHLQQPMAEDYIALVRRRNDASHGALMRDALEYIDQNLSHQFGLATLAAQLRVSAPDLAYHFRKEAGTTFLSYLASKRIEEACILLNDRSLSIAEIASMVGFRDPSHFIRQFKAKKMTTPGEFRRSLPLA